MSGAVQVLAILCGTIVAIVLIVNVSAVRKTGK